MNFLEILWLNKDKVILTKFYKFNGLMFNILSNFMYEVLNTSKWAKIETLKTDFKASVQNSIWFYEN